MSIKIKRKKSISITESIILNEGNEVDASTNGQDASAPTTPALSGESQGETPSSPSTPGALLPSTTPTTPGALLPSTTPSTPSAASTPSALLSSTTPTTPNTPSTPDANLNNANKALANLLPSENSQGQNIDSAVVDKEVNTFFNTIGSTVKAAAAKVVETIPSLLKLAQVDTYKEDSNNITKIVGELNNANDPSTVFSVYSKLVSALLALNKKILSAGKNTSA